MIVDPDYRDYRIDVNAVKVDGAWKAEFRIRRTLSEDKPHVEQVTCRKDSAAAAEQAGALWARRWVDGQVTE